jgi:hypothetical protein
MGGIGDNPLSDLVVYNRHPFPADVEALLLKIDSLGRRSDRWPLGENWPFSPREFDWERGLGLDSARRDLADFVLKLEAGLGDEIMLNPTTRKPLNSLASEGA